MLTAATLLVGLLTLAIKGGGPGAGGSCHHDNEGARPLGTPPLVRAQGDGLEGWCRLSRLYVGNLAHGTTEADLRAAFSSFGEVASVRVMSDRRGRTKQFGYVQMADETSAKSAMAALRGTRINGRMMDIVLEDRAGGRSGGSGRAGRRR